MEHATHGNLLLPDNYYLLNIYLTNKVPKSLEKKYKTMMENNNSIFDYYSHQYIGKNPYIDAGIDLYCPTSESIKNGSLSNKVDMGVKCSMIYISVNTITKETRQIPCGYYLYPRSSTGSKSPLRLSNSIGVMDSGYRGNVIACFDNIDYNNQYNENMHVIDVGSRLVQICSPNITYPTLINIVPDDSLLDIPNMNNRRGAGGFGSTGR